MSSFFDALETRDPVQREAQLLQALPRQVAHAQTASTAYAQILAGVDPSTVSTRAALARLPVTRKSELFERQKTQRPEDLFGGFSALRRGPAMPRIFSSPGPVYEPEGAARDYWRAGRALYAAGFRAGDLVHNSFSYHMTPGAFIMESGAHAVGCTVFPAGVGQTEQQLQAIAELQPNAYVGTPSFLRILLEKAQSTGIDVSCLRKGVTGGEALPPTLRDWFAERGMAVFQSYATADLGLIAYETEARQGLVLDESVLVEIVRPGTGDPVSDGEVGEVVVTTLNPDYPLIRFGTGDLSALLGRAMSHRTNQYPNQGLDGARRSDHQDSRHVCPSGAGGGYCAAISGSAQGAAGGHRRTGQRRDDAESGSGFGAPRARSAHRRSHPRHHQAARRCTTAAARHLAERWQGD